MRPSLDTSHSHTCARARARSPCVRLMSARTPTHEEVHVSEHQPIHEESRLEEHKVYALLAIPIFIVTIFIIGLLTMFGTSPRP